MNKSAISRVSRVARNTVDRWLEKAAECCRRFNDETIKDLHVPELQADEIATGPEGPAVQGEGQGEAPVRVVMRRQNTASVAG